MDLEFVSKIITFYIIFPALTLLFCGICFTCVPRAYSLWKHVKIIQKIPGPYLHPLWGTMDRYPPNEDGLNNWGKYMSNHPEEKVTLYRIGPFMYFIVIVYPEEIAKLLCMKPSTLPKDQFMYGVMKSYLGEGLLISNFDKWQTRRRMLTPGFHYDILKPYVLLYNQIVEVFISKCEGKLENGETVISTFENITLLTLDVMLQCACSYKSGCQFEQTEDRYINAVKANADLALKQVTVIPYLIRPIFYLSPHGFAWRKNCRIVKEQTLKIVQSRRESLVENPNLVANKPHKDFIDILITSRDSSGNGLTDEGIVEEMTTFLFEGHDTTASAISWTLHLLGLHTKYQTSCREEVRKVLKGRNSDRIQWEDLSNLTFLTMCIKESMRLFMPVNDIYRMAHEDMHFNGYFIPKGSRFLLSIGGLHRNPNVWENPLEYNPMRFDCELPGGHPFAFLPFSAGHRNCIGQKFAFNELLVAIGRIINKFEIESLTKEPRRVIPVIVKPEEDLKIRLKLAK